MHPVVETLSGRLQGRMLRNGVAAFRGIPYARPPVGARRFLPPAPAEPWAGVRDAFETGPSAPQPKTGTPMARLNGFVQKRIAEDCLYLNVWTPRPDVGKRPVLVWVHGGAFLIGSGASFLYDGRRLAQRGDVVVVTLNYRLGAFGFLNLRPLGLRDFPANTGLRDQIAALEWVRDNIAAFGGDPDNVTVFGESAGAMSLAALLASPRACPRDDPPGGRLFRRAILQSGAAHDVSTPEQAGFRARRFLAAAGLAGRPVDRDLLADLQRLSVQDVLAAQRQAILAGSPPPAAGPWTPRLPWEPSIDGDLIPGSPLAAIRGGSARSVEVLIGSTSEEWKLFSLGRPRLRRMGPRELARRTAKLLRTNGFADRIAAQQTREAVAVYRDAGRSPFDAWIQLRSDEIFRIPAIRLAEAQAPNQPRTFTYLFDFPAPAMPRYLGCCHALDLPFTFGTLRHPAVAPLFLGNRKALRLSATLQDAWLAFARRGQPSHPGLASWPAYDDRRRTTLRLGAECYPEHDPGGRERRFWEGRLVG